MGASLPNFTRCCNPTTDEPPYVPVPGPAGEDGADGAAGSAGVNSYTTLTAGFTVPAVGATVLLATVNSAWMAAGQLIFIQNAGYYQFVSSTGATNALVQNLGYTGNAAPTTVIATSQKISPGGVKGADGAAGAGDATSVTVSLAGSATPVAPAAGIISGIAYNEIGQMWRYAVGPGWVLFAS